MLTPLEVGILLFFVFIALAAVILYFATQNGILQTNVITNVPQSSSSSSSGTLMGVGSRRGARINARLARPDYDMLVPRPDVKNISTASPAGQSRSIASLTNNSGRQQTFGEFITDNISQMLLGPKNDASNTSDVIGKSPQKRPKVSRSSNQIDDAQLPAVTAGLRSTVNTDVGGAVRPPVGNPRRQIETVKPNFPPLFGTTPTLLAPVTEVSQVTSVVGGTHRSFNVNGGAVVHHTAQTVRMSPTEQFISQSPIGNTQTDSPKNNALYPLNSCVLKQAVLIDGDCGGLTLGATTNDVLNMTMLLVGRYKIPFENITLVASSPTIKALLYSEQFTGKPDDKARLVAQRTEPYSNDELISASRNLKRRVLISLKNINTAQEQTPQDSSVNTLAEAELPLILETTTLNVKFALSRTARECINELNSNFVYLYYTGHGSLISSGIDASSAVTALEMGPNNQFIDANEISSSFVQKLPRQTRLFAFVDACHSANPLLLPLKFECSNLQCTPIQLGPGGTKVIHCQATSISATNDLETGGQVRAGTTGLGGALTMAMLESGVINSAIDHPEKMLGPLREKLIAMKQTPQLCATCPL